MDYKALYEELKEENKKLKKYETMIHCVWSDLYWADKGGYDVSFKDISASCDYYENEEFVKKEVVEDNEEEEEEEEEEEIEYPRSKPIGQYPSAVDTEEEEERITIDYFKNNPALSRAAVMKFVMGYNTGQQPHQSYIDTMKKMTPAQFDLAYWGYKELFNPEKVMNEEKVKEIGAELNRRGNIDLMRVSYYLMSWDINNAGMLIGSYPRIVEHYWDGIGDWMA